MKAEYTCVHKVWGGWEYRRCGKKADESGLCGRHKPEAIAARKTKADAKAKALFEETKRKWAEKQERERRADCFPDLLDALESIAANTCCDKCQEAAAVASAAIAKAKVLTK